MQEGPKRHLYHYDPVSSINLLHRGNLNLRRVASVWVFPTGSTSPTCSICPVLHLCLHTPGIFSWDPVKDAVSQEESFLRADSAEDFEIFKDCPPQVNKCCTEVENSVFVQTCIFSCLSQIDSLVFFFWLQLCYWVHFPKSVALISMN